MRKRINTQAENPLPDLLRRRIRLMRIGMASHPDIPILIKQFLKKTGLRQKDLADALGVAQPTVSRWARGEDEPLLQHWLEFKRFAGKYGAEMPDYGENNTPTGIPLVGWIGIGAVVNFFGEGHPKTYVPARSDAIERTVALEVRDGSLSPRIEDKWLIFFDDLRKSPNDDLTGQFCVVKVFDGDILVRHLYKNKEPGLWDLVSVTGAIRKGVSLEWAARVTWIKPS